MLPLKVISKDIQSNANRQIFPPSVLSRKFSPKTSYITVKVILRTLCQFRSCLMKLQLRLNLSKLYTCILSAYNLDSFMLRSLNYTLKLDLLPSLQILIFNSIFVPYHYGIMIKAKAKERLTGSSMDVFFALSAVSLLVLYLLFIDD